MTVRSGWRGSEERGASSRRSPGPCCSKCARRGPPRALAAGCGCSSAAMRPRGRRATWRSRSGGSSASQGRRSGTSCRRNGWTQNVNLGAERTRVGDRDRELLALIGTALPLDGPDPRARVRGPARDGRRPAAPPALARERARVHPGRSLRPLRPRTRHGVGAHPRRLRRGGGVPPRRAHPAARYVRPQFLEHLVWLNDLFVALCLAGGSPVRVRDRAFRWLCDADRPLTFRPRPGEIAPRAVAPDALIELPAAARRVFVEAERGTHTIVPVSPKKHGATLRKLERYSAFFSEFTSAAANATPYTEHFPDAMAPRAALLRPDREQAEQHP